MNKKQLVPSLTKPEDSPGFLLWQLSNRWQSKQRAALKAFNLTHVQFVLLASLTYFTGETRLTQKALALHAQTDVMMTSQVVRVLEKKGLVQRESSETDKRAFILSPTSAGIKLVNQAIKEVEAVDKQFFGVLPRGDRQKLIEAMRRLVH